MKIPPLLHSALLLRNFKYAVTFGLAVLISTVARGAWILQDSHAPRATFRAIQAIDAKTVWVAGTAGTCRRTVDGGETWEAVTVPDAGKLDFRGLFAFDDQTAVLMSSGEASQGLTRIYRTMDAGRTWQVVFQTVESNVFLDGISSWDRTNGLAVGDSIAGKWYLLKTQDGGQSWERVPPSGLPAMLPGEGAFAAGNTSMVMAGSASVWLASGAAERSRVFQSSDRGQTWEVRETPMPAGETAGIYSLRRVDVQRAVAVGGDYKMEKEPSDNVIVTTDGGQTWQKAGRTDPPGLKETVVVLSDDALLAIGPNGTSVSRDFAKTWQKVDGLTLHAASCAAGQCWAVGSRGTIVKWKPEQ
jgi:photosystem II stability/assembly factor-like uncharacterized protein